MMDRRNTLNTLLGRNNSLSTSTKKKIAQKKITAPPTDTGLEPFEGEWNYAQAAHLLRRTTFGATHTQIKEAFSNGLEATLNTLLSNQALPDPPLNSNDQDDPFVPIGDTWINQPFSSQQQRNRRTQSIRAWTMELLLNDGVSIREKMVLFWHNHFVTQITTVKDPMFIYDYSNTLRENALGNFKELVKLITVNPAMLRYLNGNQNSRVAPNENYARELLELFTIGKGALAGPGDYTTFTEDDVIAIAKSLTGWRDRGYFTDQEIEISAAFIPNRHDTSTKILSHRFNNATITDAGDQEYINLIDLIFEQAEVAKFISRKLYRWFVYYKIDDSIEEKVIDPMAQLLIDNNFEILPVLEVLFRSAHFHDIEQVGCMIKNPLDFVMGVFRQFEVETPTELQQKYRLLLIMAEFSPSLQMEYYDPPNVAGWKAYYQAPIYSQIWLNSVTIPIRMTFTTRIALQGYEFNFGDIIIDPLAFLSKLDEPADVNNLIDECVQILLPKPITDGQKDYLKNVLIPGLPDYEWNVEYSDYAIDPSNEALAIAIGNKIRNLLATIMSMPEYHLS